ncbi:hypothetical protein GEMRC1_006370 [Eukaryota sp. GEM-RC1]
MFPHYRIFGIIGEGSFGVVYQGSDQQNALVAIKRTPKNGDQISREVSVLRSVRHPFIIHIRDFFYSSNDDGKEDSEQVRRIFQNLVMDYIPSNLDELLYKSHMMTYEYIMSTGYQLLMAGGHLQSLQIVHRDLKPSNILFNPQTREIKVADFGSAKELSHGQKSVCYMCTRNYRAPELVFGSTTYDSAVDRFSIGCIIAELFLKHPLFKSKTTEEHTRLILAAYQPSIQELQRFPSPRKAPFEI